MLSLWKLSICLRELFDDKKSNWITLTPWSVERSSSSWDEFNWYLKVWCVVADTSKTFSAGITVLSQSRISPPRKLPKLFYSWIKSTSSYKGTRTKRNRRGVLLKSPVLHKSWRETIQKSCILNISQIHKISAIITIWIRWREEYIWLLE